MTRIDIDKLMNYLKEMESTCDRLADDFKANGNSEKAREYYGDAFVYGNIIGLIKRGFFDVKN